MTFARFFLQNKRWLSAGLLLTLLSSFGQTFFISIFSGEIRETFDLSHGQWGGIYSLGTSASAIAMVWAGGLTDRMRVRALGSLVLGLLFISCLTMAAVPVWWLLPLVIFLLRFSGQGMSSHVAVVAMSRWFISNRGKALSIATLGFAFGEALLPLLFVALMAVFNWQILWIFAGLFALAGVPVLMALLKSERTPQSLAESEQSLGMSARHWSRRDVLRHSLFWFMVPALLGPSAFNTAFFFHQVYIAELKNMALVELVAMFPFYTGISIGAMLLTGWALDKIGTPRLIPFMQIPMIISFVVFAYADGYMSMLIGFLFLALTTGANTTLPNAFWAEFFGTAHLGSIKAMAAAIMVLGSAIGPGLTGLGIDYGIGLETQFLFVAVYFGFATIMMFIGISRAKPLLSMSL